MAIYLTLVVIVLNHIAFGGSRVVVSLFALESGATQMQVGFLMALYALCPMLFAIAIGRLADRVGPRLPMLLGSTGLGLALGAVGLAARSRTWARVGVALTALSALVAAALTASGLALEHKEALLASASDNESLRLATRSVYRAGDGRSFVEHWTVDGSPHAWAGGNPEGSYTDPQAPGASAAMLAFFLQHSR